MEHLKSSFEFAQAVIEIGQYFDGKYSTNDADNVLNRIAAGLTDRGGFNQNNLYGDNFDQYQITLGDQRNARLEIFFLKDFLFPGRNLENVQGFDDFMRTLDRDRLGDALRQSLISTFELPLKTETTEEGTYVVAPQFWRRDIRRCSHPDYAYLVKADNPAPVPVPIAA